MSWLGIWNRGAAYWQFSVALLLTLGGAVLRTWQIGESLWLDELHTAWCASGSFAEVAPRAILGNQSPLFFWLEWLLVTGLGASELVLRLPSLIAGCLLPLAVYGVARRGGLPTGVCLLAVALVVIGPLLIFFATEARPYAAVQLLAVIHVGICAQLFVRPSAALRLWFVGGAAALFYLHYTALLLVAAEVVAWCVAAVMCRQSVQYGWRSAVVDLGWLGLLCLPAAGNLQSIFARRQNWDLFVPPRSWLAPWEMFEPLPWSPAVLFIVIALMATWLSKKQGMDSGKDGASDSDALVFQVLVVCWLVVPLLVAWLMTATGLARLFFPRYIAASAPAATLVAAMCASLPPWRWTRAVLGIALIVTSVWNSGIVERVIREGRIIGDRREDWRGAIAWLNDRLADEPLPVFVASGLIESEALLEPHDPPLVEYCLFPLRTSIYPLQAERRELIPLALRNPAHPDPRFQELISERGGGWFVVRGRNSEAQGVAGSWRPRESRSFGRVRVFRVAPPAER